MEIKRKIEVFIETSRRYVVHQPESPESNERTVCPECAAPMLAAEQIAVLLGMSRRSVYQLVETGAAHFIETGNGFLLVCPNSLAEFLTGREENHEID